MKTFLIIWLSLFIFSSSNAIDTSVSSIEKEEDFLTSLDLKKLNEENFSYATTQLSDGILLGKGPSLSLSGNSSVYPPPYMIGRINYIDTCKHEAEYYFANHCPACNRDCCLDKYQQICQYGFRMYDTSSSDVRQQMKNKIHSLSKCTPECKPYYSYVIASIRCRQKIRSSCTYDWSLTPLYTPPPNVRMCCGLHFYSSVCMSNWNDKKLYSVPSVYVEQQSPICRLLNVPDFVILTCGYWIRPKDVEPLLTWNQAPKGLDKFNLIDNCTIVSQSKDEPNEKLAG